MKEKAKCIVCGNVCEVKVSSGHNKPENKGKHYFSCSNCDSFHWVINGVPTRPSNAPLPASTIQNRPEQEELVSETIGMKDTDKRLNTGASTTTTKTPYKERDYDSENHGKVRSLFVQALISKRGLEPITQGDIDILEGWVEYAFTGKLTEVEMETVDQDELDKIFPPN